MNSKKLIIFDMDGTLIDSVPDLALSVNLTLEKLNLNTFPIDTIKHWVGNGANILIARALSGDINIDKNLSQAKIDDTLSIFLDIYRDNLTTTTKIYPNVKETLEVLEDRYILAISTNKPEEFVKPILEGMGIFEYFDCVVGASDKFAKKPSPESLEYICNRYDVDITDAVMIGDSKNDILSAKNANIEIIAVTYGYNHDEDISMYKPDIIIDDFKDILKVL